MTPPCPQAYVFLYILSLLHGLARLTAPPRFWLFFIGPGIIFILDKIVTLRTKYMKLDILEYELLPSDVTKVKFYRPPNMKVLSGQWIRFSCTALQPEEFHSFTLTSAPHEDYLSVHIKAIGPFTWKLRNYFKALKEGEKEEDKDNPAKIKIEGPFGGGNQVILQDSQKLKSSRKVMTDLHFFLIRTGTSSKSP